MEYITGYAALNAPVAQDTPGDWHMSAVNWSSPLRLDDDESPFGDWGILDAKLPQLGLGQVRIASNVRACLDLIEQGYFETAGGMREYFISNERYTPVIFEMLVQLEHRSDWEDIDSFLCREYGMDWIRFKERRMNWNEWECPHCHRTGSSTHGAHSLKDGNHWMDECPVCHSVVVVEVEYVPKLVAFSVEAWKEDDDER